MSTKKKPNTRTLVHLDNARVPITPLDLAFVENGRVLVSYFGTDLVVDVVQLQDESIKEASLSIRSSGNGATFPVDVIDVHKMTVLLGFSSKSIGRSKGTKIFKRKSLVTKASSAKASNKARLDSFVQAMHQNTH